MGINDTGTQMILTASLTGPHAKCPGFTRITRDQCHPIDGRTQGRHDCRRQRHRQTGAEVSKQHQKSK